MKTTSTTFEVECFLEEIKKVDASHGRTAYIVKIHTDDNRSVELTINEDEDSLNIVEVNSSHRLWHKEEIAQNLLSYILFSEQRAYWNKQLPDKTLYYNRKKLDLEELMIRHRFISQLDEIDSFLEQHHKSPSTKDTYRKCLRVFFRYLSENHTTHRKFGLNDIQQFLNDLGKPKKVGEETIQNSEYYVEKMYFAIAQYVKKRRPELAEMFYEMISIPEPADLTAKAPKALKEKEVNKIFRELEEHMLIAKGKGQKVRYFEAVRNLTIAFIFFESGLRLGEVHRLNIQDIELSPKKGLMRIIGKRKKIRHAMMGKETRKWLKEYIDLREELYKENEQELGEEYTLNALFISNQFRRMSERSIYRIFERLKVKTHPHAARHTLLTKLVREGVDLVIVKEIAGHSNINTTARYSKPDDDELHAIINKER